jgi:hypothetical protein
MPDDGTLPYIFQLVVLLFGFAWGYGVREWISRRRRHRYRRRRSTPSSLTRGGPDAASKIE